MKILYGDREAAKEMGMDLGKFRRKVEKGVFPKRKLGVQNVYYESELKAAISEIVNQ